MPELVPTLLGVRCDTADCRTVFEADFAVAVDATRDEAFAVILNHVERHEGWRVDGAWTYCLKHSATELPEGDSDE